MCVPRAIQLRSMKYADDDDFRRRLAARSIPDRVLIESTYDLSFDR